MTEGLVVLAAGCLLSSVDTTVSPSDDGLRERTTFVVDARGPCERMDLRVPPGVSFDGARGRLRLGDGSKRRIDDARLQEIEPGIDGWGRVRVHLADLLPGDRAVLRVDRTWPMDAPLRWRPGADGAAFAELTVKGDAEVQAFGVERQGRRGYWVASPDADSEVRVGAAPLTPPDPVDTRIFALPALDAFTRATRMAWLPRGVDGPHPVAGQRALSRGAADDRGFARTLVRLADDGPDRVELGFLVPDDGDVPTAEEGEVAVWWADGTPTVLAHPDAPAFEGRVFTPSGAFEASHTPDAAPAPTPPDVDVRRALTLALPPGQHPQASLWPGGGSEVVTTDALTFPPHDRARAWRVPLPPTRSDLVVDVRSDDATWRERPDGVVLVVPPSADPIEATVSWRAPDAPSWGEVRPRAGERLTVRVDAPGGTVRWEGDRAWRLVEFAGVPVLPDRQRLLAALSYRFDGRAMPEPGLPLELKGHDAGWDLAEALPGALFDRARPAPLDVDPLWPRKLMKARRSGVVSPVEAALIVRLYAMQARMPADWVLVRPAPLGPGPDHVPAGTTDALVRITWDGETRWLDPSCTVCAPFELRPDLEGATALGPAAWETPPPTPGRHDVEIDGDAVTWRLEGPPGQLLRAWLAEIPTRERQAALAARIAGPEATLVDVSGVSEPGAPIVVRVEGAAPADPLAVDDTWVPWIGARSTSVGGAPGRLVTDAFSWERDDGGERLVVHRRRWSPDEVDALRAARAAEHPEPPPAPDEIEDAVGDEGGVEPIGGEEDDGDPDAAGPSDVEAPEVEAP